MAFFPWFAGQAASARSDAEAGVAGADSAPSGDADRCTSPDGVRERAAALAAADPVLKVDGLVAGYGIIEVVHDIGLQVGAGQSVCLIGPNGCGKSTILNAICGLADVWAGRIEVRGKDLTHRAPAARLRESGMAYLLQESSVFPDMTVEENLMLGAHLLKDRSRARYATQRIFDRYPALADRRRQPARVLSGCERRLLEISRALMIDPQLLLIDEPSVGLEPRYVEMVFEIVLDLRREGKAVLMVEQNVRRGLEAADIGYVVIAGEIVMAGTGRELLGDPAVGRLLLQD